MQYYGPCRVWLKGKQMPGLAMTRSIGDMIAAGIGVTAEPEIKTYKTLTAADKAIVVASDGIWDRISNDEVAKFVMDPDFYMHRNPDGAAGLLVKEAAKRWRSEQGMIDDITIIVAYLDIPDARGERD